MQTTLSTKLGSRGYQLLAIRQWEMIISVRDLVYPLQLGSCLLIGHQGANNTRLSTHGMRQSLFLIQQPYLNLICPYSSEPVSQNRVCLPEPGRGHIAIKQHVSGTQWGCKLHARCIDHTRPLPDNRKSTVKYLVMCYIKNILLQFYMILNLVFSRQELHFSGI